MPEFVTVATTDELAPGERIVVEYKDNYIAIFQVGDRYYAIEDVCTHDDGPLAHGHLDGTVIECPRHGARFDITTGAVLSMPAIKPVRRYDIQVVGDDIQILI
jgi:3-phenylpropionate/trans-cinnamate dioxygenase ferredoxin component